MLSDSERLAKQQLFQGQPAHVGFEPYYQAGIELGKLKTAAATAVSVFHSPATLVVSNAMETEASGTSSVSLMEAPTGVEGDTTRPTSAMQVSSSDEAFVAPGGNNGIGVIERPSPLHQYQRRQRAPYQARVMMLRLVERRRILKPL